MRSLIEQLAAFAAAATFPVQLIAKATVIFAAAAAASLLLRYASASTRRAAWTLAILAALSLPVVMLVTPAWRIAVNVGGRPATEVRSDVELAPSGRSRVGGETAIVRIPVSAGRALSELAGTALANTVARTPVPLILAIWAVGFLAVALRMLVGRISLGRLASRATRIDETEWAGEITREIRITGVTSAVRVLISREVTTPFAAGIVSPLILLPESARAWNSGHRQVVLRHELAHIASGDGALCAVTGLMAAVYWFHPLAWMAARKLRIEQERACDDRVLSLGTPATTYATHLLEVARTARSLGMSGFVSMAMARPSHLEGRLLAVLSETQPRRGPGWTRWVSAGIATLVSVILISAFRPVASEAAVVVASQSVARESLPPIASLANSPAVQSAESVVTREISVASGGTVNLDLRTGAGITVTSWDQPRLRMRASLGGPDWRDTRLTLEPSGSGARITTLHEGRSRSHSTSHHIELTVPRRFNVRISSAGGAINIRDVEGEFTGSTGGGEIRIDRARGRADLSTGGGRVNVTRSTLSGSVGTGGGGVLIQEVEGGLRGSSGTGNVVYGEKGLTYSESGRDGVRRASDGRLIVQKSGGRVNLGSAPNGASVTTGGGDIRIGRAGGGVTARTGGGDITLGPVSGKAEAQTGAGDVTITIDGDDPRDVDVTSGNGTVTLLLPRGVSANLDLETAYTNRQRNPTRIVSDWPVSIQETTTWDARDGTPRKYVRTSDQIGGGGRTIRVKTVNGNIVIRRQ